MKFDLVWVLLPCIIALALAAGLAACIFKLRQSGRPSPEDGGQAKNSSGGGLGVELFGRETVGATLADNAASGKKPKSREPDGQPLAHRGDGVSELDGTPMSEDTGGADNVGTVEALQREKAKLEVRVAELYNKNKSLESLLARTRAELAERDAERIPESELTEDGGAEAELTLLKERLLATEARLEAAKEEADSLRAELARAEEREAKLSLELSEARGREPAEPDADGGDGEQLRRIDELSRELSELQEKYAAAQEELEACRASGDKGTGHVSAINKALAHLRAIRGSDSPDALNESVADVIEILKGSIKV